MGMRILERSLAEIKQRLGTMRTDFNRIAYLEAAVNEDTDIDAKRFVIETLFSLYDAQKMWDKAALVMAKKAGVEMTYREKIESNLKAAEYFAKAGRIADAEEMFVRAIREANESQRAQIKMARKNIYFVSAQELERMGKRSGAMKFYEVLIKMPLDAAEKQIIKAKLVANYKALGKFREAKMIEGAQ